MPVPPVHRDVQLVAEPRPGTPPGPARIRIVARQTAAGLPGRLGGGGRHDRGVDQRSRLDHLAARIKLATDLLKQSLGQTAIRDQRAKAADRRVIRHRRLQAQTAKAPNSLPPRKRGRCGRPTPPPSPDRRDRTSPATAAPSPAPAADKTADPRAPNECPATAPPTAPSPTTMRSPPDAHCRHHAPEPPQTIPAPQPDASQNPPNPCPKPTESPSDELCKRPAKAGIQAPRLQRTPRPPTSRPALSTEPGSPPARG